MEKTKQQQGFTLIELMVTIAIIAILASIAVPAFKTMIINNRVEATANRLRNLFIQTRNKAMDDGADRDVAGIGDAASTFVIIRRNVGAGDITYAADGSIASSILDNIVLSVCYDGDDKTGVKEKAVVVFPSGLVAVKGQSQLVAGDTQSINCSSSP